MPNNQAKFDSIQFRLFAIMCLVSIISVSIIVILNNLMLEYTYTYSKIHKVIEIHKYLNDYYSNQIVDDTEKIEDIIEEFEKGNNLDILLLDEENKEVYSGRPQMKKDFSMFFQIPEQSDKEEKKVEKRKQIYNKNNLTVYKVSNSMMGESLIVESKLDNEYKLYMRIQVDPIKESVQISSRTLVIISMSMVVISAIMSSICSVPIERRIVFGRIP